MLRISYEKHKEPLISLDPGYIALKQEITSSKLLLKGMSEVTHAAVYMFISITFNTSANSSKLITFLLLCFSSGTLHV